MPLSDSNSTVDQYITNYFEKIRSKTSFGNALQYGGNNLDNLKPFAELSDPVIDVALFG